MGRNRIPSDTKRLMGNPGKRKIPDEYEVHLVSTRIPSGLSKYEKKYWKIWAPSLIRIGKLTELTIPSFLRLIKLKGRLEEVDNYITENNKSLLQEIRFIDPSGQEHLNLKESAYSKLSRDLGVTVHRLEKSWGLTADSMAGLFKAKKKKSDGFFE